MGSLINWLQNERCVCVGSTAYQTGDVVRYGGHTYVAKQDATGVVPTTTASWDKLNEGFTWRDSWTDATEYAPGDAVGYGSSSYRCKLAHTSSAVQGDAKDLTMIQVVFTGI